VTLRGVADEAIRLLSGVLAGLGRRLPGPLAQGLGAVLGAVAATLLWPWLPVRRRAARAGVPVRPWAWGAAMGRMLAGAFDPRSTLAVDGWDEAVEATGDAGVLVLGAHLGPWETAAAELARRGRPPTVVAAPWPSLPRAEASVRALRDRRGVIALPRGRSGLEGATRALRTGGTVVVLVDGVSPDRRGRRGLPWILGSLAAPDALVAWALRHGAAVWVAEGRPRGVRLHVLARARRGVRPTPEEVEPLADRAVELLHAAVRRRPEAWAWVRPLAVVALAVLGGCGVDVPEPLPVRAEAWDAAVVDLAWDGVLDDGATAAPARFFAESAVVRWVDGSPEGRFERIEITAPRADGEPSGVRIEAATAEGRWPRGPIELRDVRWEAAGVAPGRLPVLRRLGEDAGWDCGGCELETLLAFGSER